MTPRTPDEWAAAVRLEFADVAGPSTLAGTVGIEVTGGADGDRAVQAAFDGGRLTTVGPGPADGPDATVTVSGEDVRAVLDGDLDPSVAFMQGRMKVAGDMRLVLDLLALSATGTARTSRARVAALAG